MVIQRFITVKTLIIIFLFLTVNCERIKNPISCNIIEFVEGDYPEQLDADMAHAVLKTNGILWMWGNNWTGQLGDGTLTSRSLPQKVENLKNIVTFRLKEGAAVAADIYGNIWYWGDRVIYDFGYEPLKTPIKISQLPGTIAIDVKGTFIDLLRNDGTIWRLIWNPRKPKNFIKPEKIPHLDSIKAISGGIALKNDGTICDIDNIVPPNQGGYIQGLYNVKSVQNIIRLYTLILKTDGTVWAWGVNGSGCLGDGTYIDKSSPVQVKNLSDIVKISANGSHCLALRNDGTVWFWGLMELDLEENIDISQNEPLELFDGLNNISDIFAAGAVKSIVKMKDNTYWVFNFSDQILHQVPFEVE